MSFAKGMEIINTFIEYYQVFADYINPVAVVGAGILAAVVAAIVLLVFLLIFRKKVLAPRRFVVLKVLAWAYFFILPMLGGYFAFQWGALNSMQNQLKENMTAKLAAYTEGMETSWEKYVTQALTTGVTDGSVPKVELSANNVVEIATEALYLKYQTTVDSLLSNDDNLIVNAVGYINHLTDGKVMSYAVKKGIYKLLEEGLAMDEEMSVELMDTRLDELMQQGVFGKILGIQIDRLFNPLKKSTVVVFSVILLLVLFEIGLANYLLRKNMLSEQARRPNGAADGPAMEL